MPDEDSFRIPIPNQPQGIRLTAEEAERILLERLEEREHELGNALWELARFYSTTGRQKIAFGYVERLITNTDDPEKHAGYYLALGQLMEQLKDYDSAISYYSQAFSLEPMNTPTWYLINNNLGYCLNYLGRYAEAAAYCRAAITIDPERHNAYKNLGVALEGQGRFAEAASNFIKATKANAADPRALQHLEKLVAEHGEIVIELPDVHEQMSRCRQAVQVAMELGRRLSGTQ